MTENDTSDRSEEGVKGNYWRRLKGIQPTSLDESSPDQVPETWEGKGDVLHDAGKLTEALECYTRGLSEDPNDIDLLMKKADIFLDQKRYRSCLFCLDHALGLDRSQPDIWLMRSILLFRSGDNQGAIDSIDYSLYQKTARPEAWAVKGEALLAEDRLDEARTCLEYAMEADDQNVEVEALAQALGKKVEEAKKCPICGKVTKDGKCEACLSKISIDDARIMIAKVRDEGRNVDEAEGLLDEAKNFHEKKFYSQALKVLITLEKILGDDWTEGAYAQSIVEEAEEIALSLEADNMMGTRMIREKIKRANEVQADGRPLKTLVRAREALDLANKIARKYSDILLKEPEKKKKIETEGPVCPNCGEEVETQWVKCPVCKTDLKSETGDTGAISKETETQRADTEDQKHCPKCKEEVETFWTKCLFCDEPLTGGKGGD